MYYGGLLHHRRRHPRRLDASLSSPSSAFSIPNRQLQSTPHPAQIEKSVLLSFSSGDLSEIPIRFNLVAVLMILTSTTSRFSKFSFSKRNRFGSKLFATRP